MTVLEMTTQPVNDQQEADRLHGDLDALLLGVVDRAHDRESVIRTTLAAIGDNYQLRYSEVSILFHLRAALMVKNGTLTQQQVDAVSSPRVRSL